MLVLRASPRWRSINLAELWQFRGLLRAMTRRDLTLRYRQTALGVLWVVIQPVLAAGIFAAVPSICWRIPSLSSSWCLLYSPLALSEYAKR